MTRLEHANITVPDIDAAITFLSVVAPDFRIRHDALAEQGYRWAHVGNDDFYIALQEPHVGIDPLPPQPSYTNLGVNHLGLVVQGIDGITRQLDDKGYRISYATERGPHRSRAYYYDRAGFEWELIEYHSADPAERNRYS